jgi:hypothetical protein
MTGIRYGAEPFGSVSARLERTQADGPGNRVAAGVHPQLGADILDMVLDRERREFKDLRNFCI